MVNIKEVHKRSYIPKFIVIAILEIYFGDLYTTYGSIIFIME